MEEQKEWRSGKGSLTAAGRTSAWARRKCVLKLWSNFPINLLPQLSPLSCVPPAPRAAHSSGSGGALSTSPTLKEAGRGDQELRPAPARYWCGPAPFHQPALAPGLGAVEQRGDGGGKLLGAPRSCRGAGARGSWGTGRRVWRANHLEKCLTVPLREKAACEEGTG